MKRRTVITESFQEFDDALDFVYDQTANQDAESVEIVRLSHSMFYRVGITFEETVDGSTENAEHGEEADVWEASDVERIPDAG